MNSSLIISLRMLRRDWRAGELRILLLAMVIAVTSITSVAFFTDRIRQALTLQANELLGADMVVIASHPLSAPLRDEAQRRDLQLAETIEFPSMVIGNSNSQLAAVKAVSTGYPLRGALYVAQALYGPDEPASEIPRPGTVWLEPRLLAELGMSVGDQISLGEARFEIAAVLSREPSRAGGNIFNIAPSLVLNIVDLPQTQLIQPASRVRYRLLFAGDAQVTADFGKYLKRHLQVGERLESIEDARPEIRSALERARRFLGLAALISVMLAGVTIATSTRRFVQRHLDSCAVMRCLGASHHEILRIFVMQMLWLGLGASLIGCLLGYLAQFALVSIMGTVTAIVLPQPSLLPLLFGVLIGLATQFGFVLPPLLQLKNVPALRVLRRELGVMPMRSLSAYGLGIAVIAFVVLWQAGDIKLGFYVLAGIAACLLGLTLVAMLLLRVLRNSYSRFNASWRFGIANITRRSTSSVIQILAFGIGIMVLLLLTLIRNDLLNEWQAKLPPDTPNRFLINIQPKQVAAVEDFFTAQGGNSPELFPMVRGRLTAIGEQAVSAESYQDDRASRLVAREFNLSWAAQMQEDNRIVAGQWWSGESDGRPLLSVEDGLARTLGIRLGDALTFNIGGTPFTATVSSLRSVEWDTFRVNFFVLAPPAVLDGYPASYITSFYLEEEKFEILNRLVKAFPNITVIDVAAIMSQVRTIIERVTLAVEYVFLFTLFSGVLVIYAAIHSTLDERIREGVIMRTLGASRRQLINGLIAEFAGLGLLSGVVAAFAASLLGYILARQVFHLDYTFNSWVWVTGVLVGTLGVTLAGVLSTRFILQRPPLEALRASY